MITDIGRATLLVDDYEEALEFYVGTLGFEVLYDDEPDDGFRLVHVGVTDEAPVGIWLMEAVGEEERDLVGGQTGRQPAFVFYTDDCRGTFETLSEQGVTFLGEPREDDGSVHVHFEDLYGNAIVLAELTE